MIFTFTFNPFLPDNPAGRPRVSRWADLLELSPSPGNFQHAGPTHLVTRRALNLARWPCRVHSDVTVRAAGVTGRSGQRIGNGPQVTPPLASFCSPARALSRKGRAQDFCESLLVRLARFLPVPRSWLAPFAVAKRLDEMTVGKTLL